MRSEHYDDRRWRELVDWSVAILLGVLAMLVVAGVSAGITVARYYN